MVTSRPRAIFTQRRIAVACRELTASTKTGPQSPRRPEQDVSYALMKCGELTHGRRHTLPILHERDPGPTLTRLGRIEECDKEP